MLVRRHIAKAAFQYNKQVTAKSLQDSFFQFHVNLEEQSKANMGKIVSAMLNLAQISSDRIKKIYSTGKLQTFLKGEGDPCTIADIESQQIICGGLRYHFPEICIIGEEKISNYEKQQTLQRKDLNLIPYGTAALNRREPQNTTCLLGIAYEDDPIAGVIIKPFTNEIIWGCRGTDKLVVTSPYIRGHKYWKNHRPIAGSGSRSWEVILSKASIQYQESRNSKKWDTCAAEALIRALGGQMTDIYGKRYNYNSKVNYVNENGVAASLFDHHENLKVLKEQKYKLSEVKIA